jgi:hypothetical protein
MQLAPWPRNTADPKQVATRHWITAGVAVAGLIAVAPGVSPVLPDLHHDVQAAAVRLTAGWDPLTGWDPSAAWQTAFNTASKNATTLADNFLLAPGVGLQQAIVNEVGYLNELVNDPSSISTVLSQFLQNAQTVATGLTGVNASAATTTAVHAHTIGGNLGLLLQFLPGFLPAGTDVAAVTAVMDVLSSPLSGLLIGAVGPVISPGVALLNSALAVGAALQASDPSAALQDLLDVPANVVGSFFNGADLNLDVLLPLIAKSGFLPAGTTINELDYAFGGLLSVGSVSQGTYTQNGTITPITTPGGSILNNLGLSLTTLLTPTTPFTLNIASAPVGPLGALEGISQTVGVLLGDHWDGKGAVQVAPLSTLSDKAEAPAAASAASKDLAVVNAAANDATAVNALPSTTTKKATFKVTSPVEETAAAENATASTELVGLPKLHVPVTAPRTVPVGTTGSGAAATDATATGTAAVSNVSEGITKAVSGGTGKSSASAGSSSGTGGGGRHRK